MAAHRTRVLVVGILLGLLMPSVASAQIGRGWLERLSGPGPFRTWPVIEMRFLCLSAAEPEEPTAATIRTQHIAEALKPSSARVGPIRRHLRTWMYPREVDARLRATAVGCHLLPPDEPRLEIGFHASWAHSKDNVLDYTHLTPDARAPRVDFTMVLWTADLRVNRILDVGAGLGHAYFRNDDDAFRDFTKVVIQPMRLTTRPLAAFTKGKWAHSVQVLFDGTKFVGGFTAEDFGARPESYNEPGEMNWTWAIKLDLTAWIW